MNNLKTAALPFIFGAQYYRAPTPEPECWEQDFRTMRDLGFNAVKFWVQWRWSHRAPGKFYFDDLDRLMDLAAAHELQVTLNAIFDVAPLWLYDQFPDAKPVCCDGTVIEPAAANCRQIGGVSGPCYNHPGALATRQEFMRVAVAHFRKHPAMSMWDVWNEPEQCLFYRHANLPTLICYCPQCQTGFIRWLQEKYPDLERLDQVWGRCYGDWREVELPRAVSAAFTDLVDWREFHLDTMTSEANWRLRAVKSGDPAHIAYLHVVPNTIRIFNAVTCIDDFAFAQECEVFAGTTFSGAVFPTQLISAAAGRVTYNVECHINGGQTLVHPKMIQLPDMLRELLPQIGIGIRGFMFWQFRAEGLGGESPAWGVVKLDGSARPVTEAVREFWHKLKPYSEKLMHCQGPVAEVGIWKSRKNEIFHFGLFALNNLADSIDAYTEHFYWNNYPCRYIDSVMLQEVAAGSENGGLLKGLAGIKLLIMPMGYYLTESEAVAVDAWVRAGGVLLCEAHLGGYDGDKGRHSRAVPGCGLAQRWGIRELDTTAAVHLKQSFGRDTFGEGLAPDVRKALEHFGVAGGRFFPLLLNGGTVLAGCDRFAILGGEGLKVEATYGNEQIPVIVSKSIGSGKVFYCGTNPGPGAGQAPEGFRELLGRVIAAAGVTPVLGCGQEESSAVRVDVIGGVENRPEFIAIYNRTAKPQTLRLAGLGRYQGIFSGLELVLPTAADGFELPADFAELFARQDPASV